MSNNTETISLTQVLESGPLYRKYTNVTGFLTAKSIRNVDETVWTCPALNLPCKKCTSVSTTTWKLREVYGNPCMDGELMLIFNCQCCIDQLRSYSISTHIPTIAGRSRCKGDPIHAIKTGQNPELDCTISKELKKWLGEASCNWLSKAQKTRQYSFGVASLCYLRRIVEAVVVSLITEREAKNQKLESVGTHPTFDEKFDFIRDLLPETLSADDGFNTLKQFYSISSNGLHNLSEEECIEVYDDLYELLETTAFLISSEDAKKTRNRIAKKLLKV